jgi:Mor family transcriptional regulator
MDIENNPDYKKCIDCNEYKLLDEYYLSATRQAVKRCKSCYVIYYKNKVEDKMEMKGGSDHYYKEPNKYTSEIQKSQVFMVLELLGWEFDGEVWNKNGLKENGVFINIIPTVKRQIKKSAVPHGRKIKSGVWNNQEKIVQLINEGHLYRDVAEVYDCSHTLIRLVVSKYRNEKRTD